MPHVIAEPCDTTTCGEACVAVCPVDAIHGPPTKLRMYIDPSSCIGCAACEPECPVTAIFEQDDLPAAWKEYAAVNAEFFERTREAP